MRNIARPVPSTGLSYIRRMRALNPRHRFQRLAFGAGGGTTIGGAPAPAGGI